MTAAARQTGGQTKPSRTKLPGNPGILIHQEEGLHVHSGLACVHAARWMVASSQSPTGSHHTWNDRC